VSQSITSPYTFRSGLFPNL
jgi:20S proteasome subunit beta 6